MADQLAKKEAADKQRAIQEKKEAGDEDEVEAPKPKKESDGGLNIETSSLEDPFGVSEPVTAKPVKDDKPKETQKI